jgi:glycosyltransferase involved in cell wall biosynthesis
MRQLKGNSITTDLHSDMAELVTVIVPTKNSAGTIKRCLASIKSQTYPAVEIIVVDNYSSDGTQEIAEKYAKLYLVGPERSTQRNFGASQASGKYLLFVDSDTFLSPTVVEDCVSSVKRYNVQGAIVPQKSIGKGFWAMCKVLEKSFYIGDELIESVHFFEREAFRNLGGYDEKIAGGGEDWDLPIRIRKEGYRIIHVKSLIFHDEGSLRLSGLIRKKYYYGKTIHIYIKEHPKFAFKQLNLIRPAFLRNWKSLAKDPLHAVGLLLMKFCEFTAGTMGAVCGMIQSIKVRQK